MVLTTLPVRLFAADAPRRPAAEFRRDHPDRAWVVDRFPFAHFLAFLLLFPPVFFSLVHVPFDRPGLRLLTAALFPLAGCPLIMLPLAVLEIGYGTTLLYAGMGSREPTRVVVAPKLRRAGWVRVAVAGGLVAALAGVQASAG